METTKGKLRNITTGILHTKIDDVYLFFEKYLNAKGIMTHQLPSACRAIIPILKKKLSQEWFNEEWLKDGLDEKIELFDLTEDEKFEFWENFQLNASKMWNSIKDKSIIVKTK